MLMYNRTFLLVLTLLIPFGLTAQVKPATSSRPKAVVGIMVDQMRQEYLYRFGSRFSDGGFRRLMNQGYMLADGHYNYIPTVTGPGHASVYTGTTPAFHGILGNEWYDRDEKRMVNCVEDKRNAVVGSSGGRGAVSPHRLLSTTITDELKVFTQRRAKVIGMSIKDRGAVLPAGHLPDGAFWYDGLSGNFITSTYYKAALPLWVEQFNKRRLADQYLAKEWKTLFPIDTYVQSDLDNSKYESVLKGKDAPVFPYNLPELRKTNGNYDVLVNTPFGDDLLTDFALAALDGEEIGADEVTDFLAISYSTPDLIGHAMGPSAIELEDTFLRLDRNIENLLSTLDKKLGAGNYIVFLTSDHGVGNIPQELADLRIPAGYFDTSDTERRLKEFLQLYFPGQQVIENTSNNQIFLNPGAFAAEPKAGGIDYMVATELIVRWLQTQPGIAEVYPKSQILELGRSANPTPELLARGLSQRMSGDVVFTLKPGWGWLQGPKANHGSGYSYDTHVPILFFGHGVPAGTNYRRHSVTDIAPTLALLLGIPFPNGCTGKPVEELFEARK